MSLLFHPGGDPVHCINEYALPDFQFSFQLYGSHWRSVDKHWSYPEHEHPLVEINLVLEGCQSTTVEGEAFRMEAGDVMIIPPGCSHASKVLSPEGMTYFCLHLDIDDRNFVQPFKRLPQLLYRSRTDIAQRLRLQLEPLIEAIRHPKLLHAEDRIRVRSAMLQLMILLGEWMAVDERGEAGERAAMDRKTILEIRQLREQKLLEKKVQSLFHEAHGTGLPLDESMFPAYRWIGLFSLSSVQDRFWNKPDRYAAKSKVEEVLAPTGTPIIIFEERQMTAVVFANGIAVPPLEEKMLEARRELERWSGVKLVAMFGGIAAHLAEVRRMYRISSPATDAPLGQSAFESHMFEFIHRIIRQAMSYIQKEYANRDLSLSMLAERLDITPNYLSKLFATETGFTFTQHLIRIRMEQAKRLLSETNLKIYQICRHVGYADQAYFSRLFKSQEGLSPYEYRSRSMSPNLL